MDWVVCGRRAWIVYLISYLRGGGGKDLGPHDRIDGALEVEGRLIGVGGHGMILAIPVILVKAYLDRSLSFDDF